MQDLGLQVVLNEKAGLGMGSSIACAVEASRDATAWIIALADMPYIKSETYALISEGLMQGAAIVVPAYRMQRGHPVGFHQQYRDELLALREDRGARSLLERHADCVKVIEVNDAGTIIDIDTPDDLLSNEL
jgi:molybdenum cofactor cytidylyltransferase